MKASVYTNYGPLSMPQIFQGMLKGPLMSKKGGRKLGGLSAKITQSDLVFMKDLIEAGKVSPAIDRRYPLNEAADAMRYLEEGHARGKIAITISQNS